jgi:3-deoxy-7-phosphoheptulonate synthase
MVREAGAVMIRGGCFKPRTSPYAFQGLGFEGLEYLAEAGKKTGLPVVTEVVSTEQLSGMKDHTDVFQIATRNLQISKLLKRVGALGKPVLLNRGFLLLDQGSGSWPRHSLARENNVILCGGGSALREYTRKPWHVSRFRGQELSIAILVDPRPRDGIRAKARPWRWRPLPRGRRIEIEVHPDQTRPFGTAPSRSSRPVRKLLGTRFLSPLCGQGSPGFRGYPDVLRAGADLLWRGRGMREGYRRSFEAGPAASVSSCAPGCAGRLREQALHRYFDSVETSRA